MPNKHDVSQSGKGKPSDNPKPVATVDLREGEHALIRNVEGTKGKPPGKVHKVRLGKGESVDVYVPTGSEGPGGPSDSQPGGKGGG